MALADELERLLPHATPGPFVRCAGQLVWDRDINAGFAGLTCSGCGAIASPDHTIISENSEDPEGEADDDLHMLLRNHAPLLIAALRLAEAREEYERRPCIETAQAVHAALKIYRAARLDSPQEGK